MTLTQLLFDTSRLADNFHATRSLYYVHNKVMEEVGEAATEVAIVMGDSYKEPGKDGIVGESIDAIISLIDLIYKVDPDITEEQLVAIAKPKCEKWLTKIMDEHLKGKRK